MAALDLAACPICQARYSLARQTTKLEDRSRVSYECLECGSVLLWLGDDLWLEADRWAYQEIGRPEMVHLLHETMTSSELRELASRKPDVPSPQPPVATNRQPSSQGLAPVSVVGEGWVQEPAMTGREGEAAVQAVPAAAEDPWAEETSAAAAPAPATRVRRSGPSTTRRRRSRGSPFLVGSVAFVLLCLVCSSAVMIASTTLSGRVPQESQPTDLSLTATTQAVSLTDTAGVPEPTPSPTTTPPPVATEPPASVPTAVSAVAFQGVTDYVADSGSHYLVGEVLNTTGDNLRFVEILASFYDAGGQLVGTGSTFTELGIIEAGSTAPFELVTLDPPPSLASYKLWADFLTTDLVPQRLDIVSHSASVTDSGWYTITGEIRNPHEVTVRFPEIVATYYNATHQVVRVEVAFSELDALQPGQASPFEVVLVDPPADLHHYALQTEAVPEE